MQLPGVVLQGLHSSKGVHPCLIKILDQVLIYFHTSDTCQFWETRDGAWEESFLYPASRLVELNNYGS